MATTATAFSAMALSVDSSTTRGREAFPAKSDPAVIDGEHKGEERPLFSFGAIADVQYADREDGWNFHQTHKRYYRAGLQQLKRAVDVWLRDESHAFALQLGDVIDGCNRNGNSEAALRSVKKEIDRLGEGLPLGVLNSLGNHELYNFPKQRWAREVDCSTRAKAATSRPSSTCAGPSLDRVSPAPPRPLRDADTSASQDSGHHSGDAACTEERFYYSFCPDQAYRLVALDTYDVNAIRREPQDVHEAGAEAHPHVLATDMLSERNPNEDKNDSTGLDDLGGRFVMYNGGVGAGQVKWLEEELAEASQAGQRVIVFGHVPIHPGNDVLNCLLWNYEDVLEVMHKFDCVVMYLSGHRHRETYYEDEKGVHHISLAAALEAPPDQEAFASVDVYANRLELRGHGVVESRKMTM